MISGGAHLLWKDLQHLAQWINAVVILEELILQNTHICDGHLNKSAFVSSNFDKGLFYIQVKWKYLLQLAVEHLEMKDLFLPFFTLSSKELNSSDYIGISSFDFLSGGYVPFYLQSKQITRLFLQSGHEYLILIFSFNYSSLQLNSGNAWSLRKS